MTELQQAKQQLDNLNVRRVQALAKMQQLEAERAELLRKCQLLNVDPQKIKEAVAEQKVLAEKELTDIQNALEASNVLERR
jgi:hypothetical protein